MYTCSITVERRILIVLVQLHDYPWAQQRKLAGQAMQHKHEHALGEQVKPSLWQPRGETLRICALS